MGHQTGKRIYLKHYKKIPKGWVVHHIDHDHNNNSLENLIAIPVILHRGIHALARSEERCIPRHEIEQALALYLNNHGYGLGDR